MTNCAQRDAEVPYTSFGYSTYYDTALSERLSWGGLICLFHAIVH
jgi:hypothetical protein